MESQYYAKWKAQQSGAGTTSKSVHFSDVGSVMSYSFERALCLEIYVDLSFRCRSQNQRPDQLHLTKRTWRISLLAQLKTLATSVRHCRSKRIRSQTPVTCSLPVQVNVSDDGAVTPFFVTSWFIQID